MNYYCLSIIKKIKIIDSRKICTNNSKVLLVQKIIIKMNKIDNLFQLVIMNKSVGFVYLFYNLIIKLYCVSINSASIEIII